MDDFMEEWGWMILVAAISTIALIVVAITCNTEYEECVESMTREGVEESAYVIELTCEEIVYD